MIEVCREAGLAGNCLVTIAIGSQYEKEWRKFAAPSWLDYCNKHDLGLYVVVDDLIDQNHPKWKKATWQKLLIGAHMGRLFPQINNVCYLDTDILINSAAPSIFDYYDSQSYGLVSQINNLPMSLELVMRQYVFLRHNYYSKKYPLDSVVFMPVPDQYEYSGLTPLNDSACAGLILFNVDRCASQMELWFEKYDRKTASITDGDQTHLNWEMINSGKVQWLPYEFQALWVYEMAWKYSFLYTKHQKNTALIKDCIEACLFSNYFLHFAGSWHESDMWLINDVFTNDTVLRMNNDFQKYRKQLLTGAPAGMVKPE